MQRCKSFGELSKSNSTGGGDGEVSAKKCQNIRKVLLCGQKFIYAFKQNSYGAIAFNCLFYHNTERYVIADICAQTFAKKNMMH